MSQSKYAIISALSIASRRTIFREMTSPEAVEVFRRGGEEDLWTWIVSRHSELKP